MLKASLSCRAPRSVSVYKKSSRVGRVSWFSGESPPVSLLLLLPLQLPLLLRLRLLLLGLLPLLLLLLLRPPTSPRLTRAAIVSRSSGSKPPRSVEDHSRRGFGGCGCCCCWRFAIGLGVRGVDWSCPAGVRVPSAVQAGLQSMIATTTAPAAPCPSGGGQGSPGGTPRDTERNGAAQDKRRSVSRDASTGTQGGAPWDGMSLAKGSDTLDWMQVCTVCYVCMYARMYVCKTRVAR
jgi:hypothetical protein